MKVVFTAKSVDGKLSLGSEGNTFRFKQWLEQNPNKMLKIEPIGNERTNQQNRYYWLYLGIIERETGNCANYLHEYFKRIHLPPTYISVMGKEIKIPTSTTDLKKHEMSDYLDKICAETGVPLPDPEEAGYILN